MKRLPVSAAMLCVLLTRVNAADLPSRYSPEVFSPVPAAQWSGFYVGAQVGYAFGSDQTRIQVAGFPLTLLAPDYDTGGAVGGVHAGFNYQTGLAVLGLEGDLELAGVDGTVDLTGSGRFPGYRMSSSTEIDLQGSLRARLGVAIDRLMIYGTGGLAFASVENVYRAELPSGNVFGSPAGDSSAKVDEIRWGWSLGAGAEYAVTSSVTARAEYRYTNLNTYENLTNFVAAGSAAEHEPDFHALRVGASYKF
jgi:outer membrane immunogenic protein